MEYQGMKGPTRRAPVPPGMYQNRYSPVTNWNDDPFGSELFEPSPQLQKKKPPPRPPPPRLANKTQPDVPSKPSHFIRKPTVLSSLLSRKSKTNNTTSQVQNQMQQLNLAPKSEISIEPQKVFTKCEPKSNVQTASLIDLSSPPSSPTFTTRSSSDGLSVDSFGSDATTSTNHHNHFGGGNASQAESGFEDDFELFVTNRKTISKDDTFDDFNNFDPFSPPINKPSLSKKPNCNKGYCDFGDALTSKSVHQKVPTIIRVKPSRPKPPDNSALLKSTFGNNLPITMNVNMTNPIQKVGSGYDYLASTTLDWEADSSPEREPSPPMPTVPPPPPPLEVEDYGLSAWPEDPEPSFPMPAQDSEPWAVALFDYIGQHPDDLTIRVGDNIRLIRRMDQDWLYGSLRNCEGIFPSSYVEIKTPLPGEDVAAEPSLGRAVALYDLEPIEPGDLKLTCGATVNVLSKLNDEWYYGECNGLRGQFPANYVEMH